MTKFEAPVVAPALAAGAGTPIQLLSLGLLDGFSYRKEAKAINTLLKPNNNAKVWTGMHCPTRRV